MGWFPADERRRLLILRYWRLALSLVCSTFSLRLSATANQPSSASTCDHQHARFNSRETGSLLKARTGRLTNSATDSCSTDPLPQLLPRWRAAERLTGPRLTAYVFVCSFAFERPHEAASNPQDLSGCVTSGRSGRPRALRDPELLTQPCLHRVR